MLCEVYKTVNYPGGIERVLCNFSNELIKRGYDVTYVCLDTEKGLPYYYLDNHVKFLNLCFFGEKYINLKYYVAKLKKEVKRLFCGARMTFWGKAISDPKKEYFEKEYIARLRDYFKIETPDIIICADSQSLYIAQSACDNVIPTIAMCHTDPLLLVEDIPLHEIESWKRACFVQVLTESFKNTFLNLGIKRLECIPNAVEKPYKFRTYNKEYKKVIFVGRIEKIIKRPHLLVEAFSKISAKHKDWKIDFYGSIDNKKYYNNIVKIVKQNGLDDNINFCGVVNNIQEKYLEYDIYVTTSSFEGFGLSLVEAMGIGLPAIGYKNCSSVNELIEDGITGLLCDDGIDELAKALDKLMSDGELRKKMGISARKYADKFNPKEIYDEWERLLIRAINEGYEK